MALFRKVHVTFWREMETFTPEQKYFYLYLFTNEATTQCGIYQLSRRRMAFDTGYNEDTVGKLLATLIESGKVRYNEETKEVMVVNWHKYNHVETGNGHKCIIEELAQVKYRSFAELYESLVRPSVSSSQEEQEQEQEQEQEPPAPPEPPAIDPQYLALAALLADKIVERDPVYFRNKKREKVIAEWAGHIRLLVERDGRDADTVRRVVEWCQADHFWRTNILSGSKLRKQFPTLLQQMNRNAPPAPVTPTATGKRCPNGHRYFGNQCPTCYWCEGQEVER